MAMLSGRVGLMLSRLAAYGRLGVAAVGRWGPLQRLRARVARQPPMLALVLFLVPEAVSRSGWVVSTWLLVLGHAWQALAVYVATKVLAGGSALWVYFAAEPALLRVRWFAAAHGAVQEVRRAVVRRVRGWLGRADA